MTDDQRELPTRKRGEGRLPEKSRERDGSSERSTREIVAHFILVAAAESSPASASGLRVAAEVDEVQFEAEEKVKKKFRVFNIARLKIIVTAMQKSRPTACGE